MAEEEEQKESDVDNENNDIIEEFRKPRPRAMRSRMDPAPRARNAVSIWERSGVNRTELPLIKHQRGSAMLNSDPYADTNQVLNMKTLATDEDESIHNNPLNNLSL